MSGPLRAGLGAAASALLLGLAARAQAPWHLLVFVGWVPFLLGLSRQGAGTTLWASLLLCSGFTALGFSWLAPAIAAYSGAGLPVAWASVLLLGPLVLQPQIACAALLRWLGARLAGDTPRRGERLLPALLFAFGYVACERLLPKLFAESLGEALHPSATLRQGAELAGAGGLTLLSLLCNECLAALIAARAQGLQRRLVPALCALLLPGALWVYGTVRLEQLHRAPAVRQLRVGVVQAAITHYDKLAAEQGTFEAVQQILGEHFALSARLLEEGPLDLLVWPETVYPTSFGTPKSEEGAAFDAALRDFTARTGVPLLFGTFAEGPDGEYNAAVLLTPAANEVRASTYRKSLLFPLTEEVPALLDWPLLRAALPWAGRWARGPGPELLALPLADGSTVRLGPLICYEAIDAVYGVRTARGGPDLLVALSNDAWFPDDTAPRLHLLLAGFRSVETRLPLLRATNSGLSALVLPSGEEVQPTSFGEKTARRYAVPLGVRQATPLLLLGDWLAPCAVLVVLLLLGSSVLRQRQRQLLAGAAVLGERRGAPS